MTGSAKQSFIVGSHDTNGEDVRGYSVERLFVKNKGKNMVIKYVYTTASSSSPSINTTPSTTTVEAGTSISHDMTV